MYIVTNINYDVVVFNNKQDLIYWLKLREPQLFILDESHNEDMFFLPFDLCYLDDLDKNSLHLYTNTLDDDWHYKITKQEVTTF